MDFENYLDNLFNYLKQPIKQGEALNHILRLVKLFDNEVPVDTIDTIFATVFDKKKGFLEFIPKANSTNSLSSVNSEIFKFLFYLIKHFQDKIEVYVGPIRNVCMGVITSKSNYNEKLAALQVLELTLQLNILSDQNTDNIEAIYKKLLNSIKLKLNSSTVQKQLLITVSVLMKKFPIVINHPEDVLLLFITTVHNELKLPDDKTSLAVIEGGIEAINNYLEVFPLKPDNDRDICSRIYNILKTMMDPKDSKRRTSYRAALNLIAQRGALFTQKLILEHDWWHKALNVWIDFTGVDDQRAGFKCLDSFYKIIATEVVNSENLERKAVFELYFTQFHSWLNSSDKYLSSYKIRLGIHGLGEFANACHENMSSDDFAEVVRFILEKIECDYMLKSNPTMDQIEYLSDYVKTLSNFLKYHENITTQQIQSLQQVTVLIIKTFPKLSKVHHIFVIEGLISIINHVSCTDNISLEDFLEKVLYQGIVATCSHHTVTYAELHKDDSRVDDETYKNYMPLWNGLLDIVNHNFVSVDVDFEKRKLIFQKVFDELLKTLLVMINKLNLSINWKNDDNAVITDLEFAFEAAKGNDHVVFVNVVDFYQEILQDSKAQPFKKWIPMYIKQMILRCLKNPLVSGFYKLLSYGLRLSDEVDYFTESRCKSKEEISVLEKNINTFVQEMLNKMYNYKGDLLMSCLQVILNIPTYLIKSILPICVPALINAFTLGHSYFKVAHMAVDTLERLYRFIPSEDITPVLKHILPHLNPYISSKGIMEDVDLKVPLQTHRKTKQHVAKKRVFIESEPELLRLQKKILIFVGKLPYDILLALVENQSKDVETIIWDQQENLKVNLSFSDLNIPIYLDKTLPRIVELALNSGDRKTRASSCELLHATVMVMLGTSNQMQPTQLSRLNKLLKFIMGPLLQLGCDVDEFVMQLFSPLLMQLMHWYSNPRKYKSDETAIVIEALMDGITHETNSAVRDFSGRCIREFIVWSIKQVKHEDIRQALDNIRGILRKMNSFCLHPNPRKRLGAAMIFNNIYAVLREQEEILDQFWLEIFYNFMMNYSLIDSKVSDDDVLLVQLNLALQHIERPFIERNDIFNKKNAKNRKIPASFEGGSLLDIAVWLLEESNSKIRRYRLFSLETFSKFAVRIPKCSSVSQFFEEYVEDGSVSQMCRIQKNLNDVSGLFSCTELFKWLESFLGLLDRFAFIFNSSLTPNTENIAVLTNNMQQYFVKISVASLEEVMRTYNNASLVFTIEELNGYETLKKDIADTVFKILAIIVNGESHVSLTKTIWGGELWKFISSSIFEPYKIGLDLQVMECRLRESLNLFVAKLDAKETENGCKIITSYIIKELMAQINLDVNSVPLKHRYFIKGMVLLLKTTLGEKMELKTLCGNTFESTMNSFIVERNENTVRIVDLHNTVLEYVELKLQLGLQAENPVDVFIKYLCDQSLVKTNGKYCESRLGSFLFLKFNNIFIEFIIENPEAIMKYLMQSNEDFQIVISILKCCFENNTKYNRNSVRIIKRTVIEHWKATLKMDIQLEILKYLCLITPEPLHFIGLQNVELKNWMINVLKTTDWKINKLKLELIDFLPCITGPEDSTDEELENALENFRISYFENYRATFKFTNDVSVIFKKLWHMLQTCHSKILFRFVIKIYMSIPKAVEPDLKHYLESFINNVSEKHQLETLNMLFEMCTDKTQFSVQNRYKIAVNVFATILHSVKYEAFEKFYMGIIKMCIDTLNFPFNNNSEDIENILVDKTINFLLVEVLFSKMNTRNFETKSCPITQAAFSKNEIKTGKELLHKFISLVRGVRKENLDEFLQDTETELYRLYHCHAYNALVALISNTSKDNLVYAIFFYQEKDGRDVLWKNLFSKKVLYTFEENFDSIPGKRKALVNIRGEFQSVLLQDSKPKYVETQNMFTSTLSEDVTKFDFTNTIIRNSQVTDEDQKMDVDENRVQLTHVELEEIMINNHECMATVCGLIQHVFQAEIFVLPKNGEPREEITAPNWVLGICKILMNDLTFPNAKLFLAKVIENLQDIFKYYSAWLLEPIMKLVVDGIAGNSINFFVADLITMLSKWSKIAIPEKHRDLATNMYKFLLRNVYNEKQNLFKYNLDLIKTITEVWKSCIEIPHDVLQEFVQLPLTSNKINCGIHLTAILLANKLIPWTKENSLRFRSSFLNMLDHKSTLVYKPCAEVIGMILKHLEYNVGNEFSLKQYHTAVEKFIKNIKLKDKKLNILDGVHAHYPEIAKDFVLLLLADFPQYHGYFRQICYKIILSKIEYVIANKFLRAFDWDMLLKDSEEDAQLLSLSILYKCVKHIPLANLNCIMQTLKMYTGSPNPDCRSIMYDIFMELHRREDVQNDENILATCREILVNGLIDNDSKVHEKLFQFWSTEGNLSTELKDRFVRLLQKMYQPSTEEIFLGNCVEFILSLINSSTDFHKSIFDYPLWDCDFEEYKLLCHWRAQHASIAPMFADTLRQSQETQLQVAQLGILRATQSTLVFQPTQAMDTTTPPKSQPIVPFTSSLLLSFDNTSSEDLDEGAFKNPGKVKLSTTYRKRFYKDSSQISKYCAYNEVKKHAKREEKLKEKAKLREGNVKVFRSYRIGDFPDIEIPLSGIIIPLQNLARRDGELARIIFQTFFKRISNEVAEDDEFYGSVRKGIYDVFTTSNYYFPNVIGAFLDIALNHRNKISMLDPNLVVSVARNSGLLVNGCLLLEEYLIHDVESTSEPKRQCGSGDTESSIWIKLAELYKEMDEVDMVNAIFSKKIQNTDIISALEDEQSNDWKSAMKNYAKVTNEDSIAYRKDIYYESYFKCFAMLGDWEGLSKTIQENMEEGIDELWDEDWKQNTLLPWYVRGQLNSVLDNSSPIKQLDLFVRWLADKPKLNHLKDNYSEELGIMSLACGDKTMANRYLENYVKVFLNQWHNTNPLLVRCLMNKLLNLQRAVDAIYFMNQNERVNFLDCELVVQETLDFWRKSSNEILEPIYLNEYKILQRTAFISNFCDRIDEKVDEDERAKYKTKINQMHISLECQLINCALILNKFYVARKYLKHCNSLVNKSGDQLDKIKHKFMTIKLGFSRASNLEDNDRLENYIICWQDLNMQILGNLPQINDNQLFLSIYDQLYEICRNIKLLALAPDNRHVIIKYSGTLQILLETRKIDTLHLYGVEQLDNALDICQQKLNSLTKNEATILTFGMANAYIKLAYFMKEMGAKFYRDFIKYTLRAMKFESAEGRQLFPCLLNIKLGTHFKDTFLQEVSEIPTWMFLNWIPQLLAHLDSSNIYAISELVLRIAKTYPESIMYAYRLSKEKSQTSDTSIKNEIKRLAICLDALLLDNELVELFLRGLTCICVPETMLLHYVSRLKKDKYNMDEFLKTYENLDRDLFSNAVKENHRMHGPLFSKVKEKYEGKLKIVYHKRQNADSVEKLLTEIETELRQKINKDDARNSSGRLKSYSEFLHEFHSSKFTSEIEIPGQYTGDRLPLVQYHVKITSFHDEVTILKSIRKPIKIAIWGNNAKKYKFLVKFGEDLRQDQRIEQLFLWMNNIFDHNSNCRQRELRIETYQVIPLTSRLGIIEWVEETKTLKSAMEDVKDNQKAMKAASADYYKFIGSVTKKRDAQLRDVFGNACLKITRDKAIAKHRELANTLPWDTLRRVLSNISINSETFFAIRHRFITSYSTLCIAHWYLGIGDRHLSNTLINLRNGRAIGIDFGHAFGSATQMLQVPELVPFRLTPQVVNLVQPFDEKALIQETMVHCVRSLREHTQELVSTMDVFIREPTLDWQDFAKFQSLTTGQVVDREEYAKQKIAQTMKKFLGINPIQITLEDLDAGHHRNYQEFCEGYKLVVRGVEQHNVRAQKAVDEVLSPEEQVECLLDQATDGNLLGRMYYGWEPYI